jgi:hypothetical protein
MTMPEPSAYRACCTQCGFETRDFIAGDYSGYIDPRTKNYARLRVRRRNLLCKSCGTLHARQDVYADPPLLPVLATIGAWFLSVWIVWLVSSQIVTAILFASLWGLFALFAVRAFTSWFERNLRAEYADWIASIESLPNKCPTCGSAEALEPTRARTALPCPACHQETLTVTRTFHGSP